MNLSDRRKLRIFIFIVAAGLCGVYGFGFLFFLGWGISDGGKENFDIMLYSLSVIVYNFCFAFISLAIQEQEPQELRQNFILYLRLIFKIHSLLILPFFGIASLIVIILIIYYRKIFVYTYIAEFFGFIAFLFFNSTVYSMMPIYYTQSYMIIVLFVLNTILICADGIPLLIYNFIYQNRMKNRI